MRHVIKKQIIDLNLDRGLNSYHVQQQLSDVYWRDILPELGQTFDSLSKDEELIEVNRLELDLGVVSEKDIGNVEWVSRLKKIINEKAAEITDVSSSRQHKVRPRNLGVFEQWIFYMKHGYLAWNSEIQPEDWNEDIIKVLETDNASLQVFRSGLTEKAFLKRFVNQSEESFLLRIIELLAGTKEESLVSSINELSNLSKILKDNTKTPHFHLNIKTELWEKAVSTVALEKRQQGESITQSLIRYFAEKYIPGSTRLFRDMPVTGEILKEILSGKPKSKGEFTRRVSHAQKQDLISPSEKAGKEHFPGSDKIDEEGIFIVNAGTVLMHPFLQTLFARLDLLADKGFKSEEARQLGMMLIHYIGTGMNEAREFELTLAKILCGWPVEKPVVKWIVPVDDFLTEADLMISEAVGQWEILKNTSAAGLREGFLQRSGKLFSRNGNLYLWVEKSSIDILLDYLPWNLSIVMLPWMKDILRVEWR